MKRKSAPNIRSRRAQDVLQVYLGAAVDETGGNIILSGIPRIALGRGSGRGITEKHLPTVCPTGGPQIGGRRLTTAAASADKGDVRRGSCDFVLKRTPWPAGEASLGQASQLRLCAGTGQHALNPGITIDAASRQGRGGEVGGDHQGFNEGDRALGFRRQLVPPPIRLPYPGIDPLAWAVREVYLIVRYDWWRRLGQSGSSQQPVNIRMSRQDLYPCLPATIANVGRFEVMPNHRADGRMSDELVIGGKQPAIQFRVRAECRG
jgi:hypothetical protein